MLPWNVFFLNPALCKEIGSKQEELTKPPTTNNSCLLFQTGKLNSEGNLSLTTAETPS